MAYSLQRRVARVLDELVESGAERGIQVAAYHHGDQVVDAVAGVADPATGRPVTSATPFYNFSIGKGATATVAHLLVEQGAFGYQTPVAELWPEFAAHDKHKVTVWHVLTHSSGLPGVPLDTTVEDLCDWDTMCASLADAKLWWEPGTKMGYHGYTFGYLVGEIVRRVTGRPISQVLADLVSGPLGVADELYFSVPAAQQHRLARLENEPVALQMLADMPTDLPMFRAGPPSLFPTAELGNRADVLGAAIPAGGKTSARAIARMYAALLGEVDGVRLLPRRRLAEISAPAWSGTDEVFGNRGTWALGYVLGVPAAEPVSDTVFGMAGGGGSWAGADTARGLAIAITKNRLTMGFDAVNRIAGILLAEWPPAS